MIILRWEMFEEKIRKIVKEEVDSATNDINEKIKSMVDDAVRDVICDVFERDIDEKTSRSFWGRYVTKDTIVGMLKDGIAKRVVESISNKNERAINKRLNSSEFIDAFVKKINDKQLIK